MPWFGGWIRLILIEAYFFWYFINLRADKMYHDLKNTIRGDMKKEENILRMFYGYSWSLILVLSIIRVYL